MPFKSVPDDAAVAIALIENIQREDLNAMEEAQALDRLMVEFNLTHQQVADAVGIYNAQQIQHQINKGDFVGENLGWGNSNNTADKILGPFNLVAIATKLPKLFTKSSPHSNYFCEGSFCGYDNFGKRDKK